MDNLKIFVSHNSNYADIATSLKRSLQALEAKTLLDIKISGEMAGATVWRQWIEDNVRSADVFLLLYPHSSMELGWCNYELGRFYDSKRHVICIKNTDILKPPPTFEQYQAYDADEAGFTKFINELFVLGRYTDGRPLNPDIERVASDYYTRARNVARELAQQFADARVREHRYEKRIVLSVRYSARQEFDGDASGVEGNTEGLSLLGLNELALVNWSAVRQSLGSDVAWPAELERAIPSITTGALPPALSPFQTPMGIYIPVIAKAESVDRVLRQLVLIFVAANEELLLPLLTWVLPTNMPESLKYLIRLVRLMFSARWEILEPRYQEAKFDSPSPERCAEIARAVLAEYEEMQRRWVNEGAGGLDKFLVAFDRDLRPEVETCSQEWARLRNGLRGPVESSEDLRRQLKGLLDNNAKWLKIAGKQFALEVSDVG